MLKELWPIYLAIIGQFGTIIGLYIWSFRAMRATSKDNAKEFGRIYKTISAHVQIHEIHVKGEEKFVPLETCNALHTSLKEKVNEIGADVKELLRA